jgi:putative FmdB family regulatory protein
MPLYEYQCESCNNRFEKIQKSYSDPAPEACPKCGKGPVRKLISSPAIQFKGTGWYITDYAKKSATEAGQTGGGTSGNSDQAGQSDSADKAAKTDSKSDAKTESTSSTSSTSSSGDTAAKPAKPSA